MNTYLLLRDNRESGPYSLEDLTSKGLKPYDLVWVKDRSAAWRYPSEIDELKAFAPTVEEQPYDRFYKRPSEQSELQPIALMQAERLSRQVAAADNTRVKNLVQPLPAAERPVINNLPDSPYAPKPSGMEASSTPMPVENSAAETSNGLLPEADSESRRPLTDQPEVFNQDNVRPLRPVFVAMPGAPRQKAASPPIEESRALPVEKISMQTVPASKPAPVKAEAAPTPRVAPGTTETNIKFEQPLDEIKERYMQQLNQRKDRLARHEWWKGIAKKAAVIVALLGVGLLAGFMLRNGGDDLKAVSANVLPDVVIPDSVANEAAINDVMPATTISTNDALANNEELPPDDSAVAGTEKEETRERIVKQTVSPAATPSPEENRRKVLFDENKFARSNSIVNPETGERTRTTRNGNAEAVQTEDVATVPVKGATSPGKTAVPNQGKSASRNTWDGQVTVASNDYKRVAFGGIRNLQLTVNNLGKKALDNVVVELTYLKPSEEPLRTEKIPFRNIEAGTSSTVRVPDTNRGIKVTYKIVQVVSSGSEGVAGN